MTDFHEVRFPLHLAFGSRGGPVRPIDVVQLTNGSEVRNAKTKHARRQYNAVAGLKSEEQATELLQFFESRNGPLYGFRFRDPLDYQGESVLGTGDGERRGFALIKSYGDAPYSYVRRITKPVAGTVKVFVNGVETPVSVDHNLGLLDFPAPPPTGAVVSAQFEFDVPVRFASEQLDIALDDFGSTQIQDIPLIEILTWEAETHG